MDMIQQEVGMQMGKYFVEIIKFICDIINNIIIKCQQDKLEHGKIWYTSQIKFNLIKELQVNGFMWDLKVVINIVELGK